MHSKMADGSIRFIRQVPMYGDNHPVGCFSPYDSGNPRIVPYLHRLYLHTFHFHNGSSFNNVYAYKILDLEHL